jgi:predicted nuclease of predicted toxin-antitoxin system
MKILLDEYLPLDLRHSFPSHDAHTAQWAGFKSKKNGELLLAAERAGYDILLTVDQGISQQQDSADRKLSIVVVRSRTNQIEDLLPFVDAILNALTTNCAGPNCDDPIRSTTMTRAKIAMNYNSDLLREVMTFARRVPR